MKLKSTHMDNCNFLIYFTEMTLENSNLQTFIKLLARFKTGRARDDYRDVSNSSTDFFCQWWMMLFFSWSKERTVYRSVRFWFSHDFLCREPWNTMNHEYTQLDETEFQTNYVVGDEVAAVSPSHITWRSS